MNVADLTDEEVISLNKDKFSRNIQDNLNATLRGDVISKKIREAHPKSKSKETEELLSLTEVQNIPQSYSYQNSRMYGSTTTTHLGCNEVLNDNYEVRQWGVVVEKVTITHIAYPKNILQAMSAKRDAEYQKQILEINSESARVKAKIDAEALRNKMEIEAEANRIKTQIDAEAHLFSIKKDAEAQAIKQQIQTDNKLATANASAEARRLEAKGIADAIRIEGEAKAAAHEMEAKVLELYPEFMAIQKATLVTDAMTKFNTSNNSKVIFNNPADSNNFVMQLLSAQEVLK